MDARGVMQHRLQQIGYDRIFAFAEEVKGTMISMSN